jgi:hypothetical protein
MRSIITYEFDSKLCLFVDYSAAVKTAIIPLKKTPSNIPAPPMLATGTSRLEIYPKI